MKTFKYIALGAIGLSFMACEDFFSTESPSAMDVSVYASTVQTEQVIAGIYDQLGQDKSYRNRLACGYQGLSTDIEFNSKNSGKAEYAVYNTSLSNSELSTSNGKDPWGYLTTMIERANVAIDGIEAYSDTTKAEFRYFLGEALALRAFVYLEMVKFWGDVPARFRPLDPNDESDIYSPKVDRNVVFEQLRADLKRAARLMPWSAECPGNAKNNTGRMNKGFALGLLARSNMMYAGYALRPDTWIEGGGASSSVQLNVKDPELRRTLYKEALEACAEIIKNEDFKFQQSFEDVFRDLCEDNTTYSTSEYLWEIPFANGTRGQFMNYNAAKSENATGALKNRGSGAKTNAVHMIVPTLAYDFADGDLRRDVTIAPYEWVNDNASGMASDEAKRENLFPGTPAADKRLYQKHVKVTGFYLNKYRMEWMKRELKGGDDGVNYPVMRYADVILMFAEAAIGGVTGDIPQNNTGLDPQVQFNRTRHRAGLTDDLELNMENLMEERKFELCGEYIRKYDLMRWGKLKEKLVDATRRIADLNRHTGEFAQTGDTIYFQYRQDNGLVFEGSGLNGYAMSNVWGLRKGEVGRPEGFDADNGWVAKDIFVSETSGRHLSDFILYYDEETIDSRHYWPIFVNNLGTSNGSLWNDYGYGN